MLPAAATTTDSGSTSPTGTSSTTAQKSDVKVGLAYDVGGRGDQSFNDSAAAGLEKAKSELGVETKELEAKHRRDRRREGGAAASAGRGRLQPRHRRRLRLRDGRSTKVAADYPDVHFAIVDDAGRSRRRTSTDLVFAENEGSFLVGAAAALKTKSDHIGFVGGVNVAADPEVRGRLRRGRQGRQPGHQDRQSSTSPSRRTSPASVTRPRARPPPQGMYQGGADVVYQPPAAPAAGVFEAAKAAGELGHRRRLRPVQTVADRSEGRHHDLDAQEGRRRGLQLHQVRHRRDPLSRHADVYDLKADGVGYSTSGGMVDDIKAKLDEFKQKIISGEIKVPDSRELRQSSSQTAVGPGDVNVPGPGRAGRA